jgi:hypothetical protein
MKKIVFGIASVLIIVLALIILSVFFGDQTNSHSDIPRNYELESEFSVIINGIFQDHAENGVDISIEKLEVLQRNNSFQGFVELKCGKKLDFDTDQIIISDIANKLFEKYPRELGEESEGNNEVQIMGCSETGSSPDGINTYYQNTRWIISDGMYDFAV